MKGGRPSWGWLGVASAFAMAAWLLSRSPLGQKMFFYGGSVFAVFVVAWGCVGVGGMVGKTLELRMHPAETLPIFFALGQGVVGLLVLGMGLAGLMGLPGASFGVLVLLGTFAYVGVRQEAKPALRAFRFRTGTMEGLMAFLTLSCLSIAFLLCFLPPFEYDVLGYHLALPKRWLEAGRIHWTSDHVFAGFPLLIEMFFYLGLSWGQETFANLWISTNVLFLLLFIAGMKRDDRGRLTWLGPAVVAGSPLCMRTASSAYNDLPLAMYGVMALILLLRGVRHGEKRWVLAAGLLAGFGMGTKYHGFVFCWGFACLACWVTSGGKATFDSLIRFSVASWLAVSPWLLRNLFWTGNPFFPLLAGWLGGGMLEAHVVAFSRSHGPPSFQCGSLLGALAKIGLSFGGTVALIPWVISKSKRAGLLWLLGLVGAALIFWLAVTNRVDRFLCYSLVLWSLLLSQLWLNEKISLSRRMVWLSGIVAGVGLVQLLCFTSTCEALGLFGPVLGVQSREAFLDTHVQCHAISRELTEEAKPGERVLMVGEARTYPFEVPVSTSYPFATPPIVSLMGQSENPSQLRELLLERGFHFVLLNLPSAERLSQAYDYFHPYGRLWEDPLFSEFLRTNCEAVTQDRGLQLFRILPKSKVEAH